MIQLSVSYLFVVHLGLYSLPLSALPLMTLTEENPFYNLQEGRWGGVKAGKRRKGTGRDRQ